MKYTVKYADFDITFMGDKEIINTLCLFDEDDKLVHMLSPKAKWIKEGDILDDSQVQPSRTVSIGEHTRATINGNKTILCYKVRCPMCDEPH